MKNSLLHSPDSSKMKRADNDADPRGPKVYDIPRILIRWVRERKREREKKGTQLHGQ
jgi:hypothetical protein